MFPRIVTIAPGEGARRRQVPPSSTIPRASHPSTTTPRAANYPVCSVLPTDGRPMRKRDYGRWTCVSFRPFVSFFLPCSSLFLLSSVVLLFFLFPLLLPSSPSFFPPPPLHPGISRIENIGQYTTRFLRSFPTSNTESYCEGWEVYTISKSHKRFAIRLCLNDASSGSVHSRDAVRAWLNISLLMSKHP